MQLIKTQKTLETYLRHLGKGNLYQPAKVKDFFYHTYNFLNISLHQPKLVFLTPQVVQAMLAFYLVVLVLYLFLLSKFRSFLLPHIPQTSGPP